MSIRPLWCDNHDSRVVPPPKLTLRVSSPNPKPVILTPPERQRAHFQPQKGRVRHGAALAQDRPASGRCLSLSSARFLSLALSLPLFSLALALSRALSRSLALVLSHTLTLACLLALSLARARACCLSLLSLSLSLSRYAGTSRNTLREDFRATRPVAV